MTLSQALDLIDETGLALRCEAVLANTTELEEKATTCADLCEKLAAAIRGRSL